MTDWARALTRLPATSPAPEGRPLSTSVTCRTSAVDGAEATRHAVVIHHDWRVDVPHDLEGERVAAAFGGYLSCISLVDHAVPALREWLRRAGRLELPAMTFRGEVDRWALKDEQPCCAKTTFRDALAAADHWRSPQHVADACGASRRQLRSLTTAATAAHASGRGLGMPEGDRDRAAAACLGADTDVAWLWQAGIHPRLVWTIHRHVGSAHPLPARFYLGVVWNRPDLHWVADSLRPPTHADRPAATGTPPVTSKPTASGSDASLATWQAWAAQNWDAVDPATFARWETTGVTRPLILDLQTAGYDPDGIVALARAARRHPDGVARTVRRWNRAGFTPTPASLITLISAGIPSHHVPARAAVDRLRDLAQVTGTDWSDTSLALLLSLHGNVPDATRALSEGARPW